MEHRNRFQGIDSASLCCLAGRYENPIPAWFHAPTEAYIPNEAQEELQKAKYLAVKREIIFQQKLRHLRKERTTFLEKSHVGMQHEAGASTDPLEVSGGTRRCHVSEKVKHV
jgi:hypothetical protein